MDDRDFELPEAAWEILWMLREDIESGLIPVYGAQTPVMDR